MGNGIRLLVAAWAVCIVGAAFGADNLVKDGGFEKDSWNKRVKEGAGVNGSRAWVSPHEKNPPMFGAPLNPWPRGKVVKLKMSVQARCDETKVSIGGYFSAGVESFGNFGGWELGPAYKKFETEAICTNPHVTGVTLIMWKSAPGKIYLDELRVEVVETHDEYDVVPASPLLYRLPAGLVGKDWENYRDVYKGKRVEFRFPPKVAGAAETRFVWERVKLYPGVRYHVQFRARGKGSLRVFGPNYRRERSVRLTESWQPLGFVMALPRKEKELYEDSAKNVLPMPIMFVGAGNWVEIENFTIAYDPRKDVLPTELRGVSFAGSLKASAAQVEVWLNGKELALENGAFSGRVVTGYNVLAILGRATGANPKLSGAVELANGDTIPFDTDWACAANPPEGWRTYGFDDRNWKTASAAQQGIWGAGNSRTVGFRRVIAFNVGDFVGRQTDVIDALDEGRRPTVFCPPRIYVPRGGASMVKAYLFPLHPAPKRMLREGRIVVEVPEGLRLLSKMDPIKVYNAPTPANTIPTSEKQHNISRRGKPYRRYILTYPGGMFRGAPMTDNRYARTVHFAALFFEADADATVGDTTIFIRREGDVNLTGPSVALPVRITPPVNGGNPKVFAVDRRQGPLWQAFGREEAESINRTLMAAGANLISVSADREMSGYEEFARKLGAEHILGGWVGLYPALEEAREFFAQHPELRQVVYRGTAESFKKAGLMHVGVEVSQTKYTSVQWKGDLPVPPDKALGVKYCITWMAEDGKAYLDVLDRRLATIKAKHPNLKAVHWEDALILTSWGCYCDRCKRAFGKWAGVKDAVKLTDDELIADHLEQWRRFVNVQVRKTRAKLTEVFHRHGMETWLHDEGHDQVYDLMDGSADRIWNSSGTGRADYKKSRLIDLWWYSNPRSDPAGWKGRLLYHAVRTRGAGGMYEGAGDEDACGYYYFQGEATRLIAAHESFFLEGRAVEPPLKVEGGSATVLGKGPRYLLLVSGGKGDLKTIKITAKKGKLTRVQEFYTGRKYPDGPSVEVELKDVDYQPGAVILSVAAE